MGSGLYATMALAWVGDRLMRGEWGGSLCRLCWWWLGRFFVLVADVFGVADGDGAVSVAVVVAVLDLALVK
ncbi:MAG: hypothetical protein HC860_18650 [Alkalinema sp. RU_4_3]|nr:hypothetical protein [Alkalinema sp. RU_4_3]